MAIETVQAVRQAELNAEQKEKDAMLKRDAILADAEHNSKIMITTMTRSALTKAEHDIADAQNQGTEMMEAARIKAKNEVQLIKQILQRKEQEAIKLVLSSVI